MQGYVTSVTDLLQALQTCYKCYRLVTVLLQVLQTCYIPVKGVTGVQLLQVLHRYLQPACLYDKFYRITLFLTVERYI